MVESFEFKPNYGVDDLKEIVRLLRAPGGCPWDAEQTHESIKKNFIEETYEVVEAINKKDSSMLLEELGDVLLQVVFHTEMEREKGGFTLEDVADGICKKLIERHPHVFGTVEVSSTDEVLSNWDAIKKKTKGQKSQTQSMLSVPRELPALMRAEKIQHKAAKVGFDWDSAEGAFEKLKEEVAELKEAMAEKDEDHVFEEMGDVLFSAVNVSRFVGCDAEEALTGATDKFLDRFSKVEVLAAQKGIDMKAAGIEKLDELWDEAKSKK